MSGAFIPKRWDVTVRGYGTSVAIASTRGRALADTWRCDAFNGGSFGDFLKVASARRARVDASGWGDPIMVGGRTAFYIGQNSQYVKFVYPDSDVVLNAHPFDVEPQSYWPATYRPHDVKPFWQRDGAPATPKAPADGEGA